MREIPKELRTICMVSSAAFSAASGFFGWLAPVGAALGFAVDISEDAVDISEEFDKAVLKSLEKTKKELPSKRGLIEELAELHPVPKQINDLIAETEYYKSHYCTNLDRIEIISRFEKNFRKEIVKKPSLSHLYILSMEYAALDKLEELQQLGKTLNKNGEKLDILQRDLNSTYKKVTMVHQICMQYISSIVFIIIAMTIFWGSGILLNHTHDKIMIVVVPFCYTMAESLLFILSLDGTIIFSKYKRIKDIYKHYFGKLVWNGTLTLLVHMIVSMFFFYIIYLAIDIDDSLLFSFVSLALGSFVSVLLRKGNV